MPGEGNGLHCVPMMDGSDHSRHALARRGSEMGEQGPQGRLEFCPIQLDTVQLNWTWFSNRCHNGPDVRLNVNEQRLGSNGEANIVILRG